MQPLSHTFYHDLFAVSCDIFPGAYDQCLLHPTTTRLMLTPCANLGDSQKSSFTSRPYGLGWIIWQEKKGLIGGRNYPFLFGHSGGAVGCTSALVIAPDQSDSSTNTNASAEGNDVSTSRLSTLPPTNPFSFRPKGVVVAVIFNLQDVNGVTNLVAKIAEEFKDLNH